MRRTMSDELDLATLNVLLHRVRRHPQDKAFRLAAAREVSRLVELEPSAVGDDKLLAEAVRHARLLKRALDRANRSVSPTVDDIAAVNAWIELLQGVFMKMEER
jgi:hypothetical protein